MIDFMSGMVTAGYLIAALFFLRFWRRTKDNLFAIFAISFLLFAAGQATAAIFTGPHDDGVWTYLLRLAGFVLLIFAIARKNITRKNLG